MELRLTALSCKTNMDNQLTAGGLLEELSVRDRRQALTRPGPVDEKLTLSRKRASANTPAVLAKQGK